VHPPVCDGCRPPLGMTPHGRDRTWLSARVVRARERVYERPGFLRGIRAARCLEKPNGLRRVP
jgi:hypothetical protein